MNDSFHIARCKVLPAQRIPHYALITGEPCGSHQYPPPLLVLQQLNPKPKMAPSVIESQLSAAIELPISLRS